MWLGLKSEMVELKQKKPQPTEKTLHTLQRP